MKSFFQYLKAIVPWVWIGFVCAISFMEAWLKFTPPQVSLVVGLSIGKVVFAALNKVEWTGTVLIAFSFFFSRYWRWRSETYYLVAVLVLVVQSIWVLPFLSARIDVYLAGNTPPASPVHFYFIVLEAVKVVALVIYGIKQLREWKTR